MNQVLAAKGGQSIGIGVPLGQVSVAVLVVVGGGLADTVVAAVVLGMVGGTLGVDASAGVFGLLERVEDLVTRFGGSCCGVDMLEVMSIIQ